MTELAHDEQKRIRQFAKRLRRNNSVRIEAEELLRGKEIKSETIHRAAQKLEPIPHSNTSEYLLALRLLLHAHSSDEQKAETSRAC
jgi:hypothetical protein